MKFNSLQDNLCCSFPLLISFCPICFYAFCVFSVVTSTLETILLMMRNFLKLNDFFFFFFRLRIMKFLTMVLSFHL